jgi:hypothetical protein
MVAVVYLSSKLGLVAGEGLFAVIRKNYSRWFLFTVLAGVLIGNVIEAGADIGGMAAALNLLIPLPIGVIVVITGLLSWLSKSGALILSSRSARTSRTRSCAARIVHPNHSLRQRFADHDCRFYWDLTFCLPLYMANRTKKLRRRSQPEEGGY